MLRCCTMMIIYAILCIYCTLHLHILYLRVLYIYDSTLVVVWSCCTLGRNTPPTSTPFSHCSALDIVQTDDTFRHNTPPAPLTAPPLLLRPAVNLCINKAPSSLRPTIPPKITSCLCKSGNPTQVQPFCPHYNHTFALAPTSTSATSFPCPHRYMPPHPNQPRGPPPLLHNPPP